MFVQLLLQRTGQTLALPTRRYIAKVAQIDILILGPGEGIEIWKGFDVSSSDPSTIDEFIELCPNFVAAAGMSEEEIASVGVTEWETIDLDSDGDEDAD